MLLQIRQLIVAAFLLSLIIILAACAAKEGAESDTLKPRTNTAPPVTVLPTATPEESTPTPEVTATTKPIESPIPTQTIPLPTPTITPTATTSPVDERAQEPYIGIWISQEEIGRLPMSGPAWEQVLDVANKKTGKPDLNDKDDPVNVRVLAKALVFARTGEEFYRDGVVEALDSLINNNSEKGGDTLALGRELVAYIIAADLINLPQHDPQLNGEFEDRLRELLTKKLDGRTLQSTHDERPNNWGTHAGASRAAVAIYLADMEELQYTADVFKGWLGDRESYDDFIYDDDLSWQCDPAAPVGINPSDCEKEGQEIGGALPEELRRGGEFQWPPEETGYAWEALQGAIVQAEILHRAGYDTWEWEEQAILRAVQFLFDIGWEAVGDDNWQPWLINFAYCTSYPTTSPTEAGKNMGWTDWTHAVCRR